MLLVLDNCEHLVDAAAETVVDLLGALPQTARAGDQPRAARRARRGLRAPRPAQPGCGRAALRRPGAGGARARRRGADETDAATRIRRRLDGLPLALELAAAKARTMTLDRDRRRARRPLRAAHRRPAHGAAAAPDPARPRRLELEPARRCRALAAGRRVDLPGGHRGRRRRRGSACARRVSRTDFDVLVDKSLLQRAAGRYRALETIREYGIEKLVESGLLEQRRLEQARWLGEASRSHDALLRGPRIHDALAWFDAEDDNIVSALRFAVEGGHGQEVVALAAGNAWYWVIRDRNDDAETWLRAAGPFAADGTSDPALIVRAVSVTMDGFGSGESVDLRDALRSFNRDELEAIRRASAGSSNELLQVFPAMVTAFVDAVDRGSLADGGRGARGRRRSTCPTGVAPCSG